MKNSKDAIERYFDYDLHLESRTLWMGSCAADVEGNESGTDAVMAERVIKGLHLLSQGPKGSDPVTIQMNNMGGSWYHGMAIFAAIQKFEGIVTIEAYGYCMSMGSIIMQAADQRIIMPDCDMMIHDGSDGFSGHARNFEAWAANSKKLRNRMYQIYAERSGKPVGYWAKKCLIDKIMSAEEAVREGLADSVGYPIKKKKA